MLLPLPKIATTKGDHSKSASKWRQAGRLRQTEQSARKVLVAADVAPSQARPTEEQTFPGLACQIRGLPLDCHGHDGGADKDTRPAASAGQRP